MNSVLVIYKKRGETPLQALDRLRVEKPEYAEEKMTYAGRLDPMAEGIMLVLVGEANKEREQYLGLDKTYVARILFGISTDTKDLLGIVTAAAPILIKENDFTAELNSFKGEFSQKYPAYSSKTVNGVAMHQLARSGKTVIAPEHKVSLYGAKLLSTQTIKGSDVLNYALSSVEMISGDFRQEQIKNKWEKEISENENSQFSLFEVELSVSSGFYVRQLASDLGEKLGVPALAYSIARTKAGKWGTDDCIA